MICRSELAPNHVTQMASGHCIQTGVERISSESWRDTIDIIRSLAKNQFLISCFSLVCLHEFKQFYYSNKRKETSLKIVNLLSRNGMVSCFTLHTFISLRNISRER